MKTYFTILLLISCYIASGQKNLTIQDALVRALDNSPDIQRSQYNLDRNRESLNAQLASLKSNMRLNITPINFSKDRILDNLESDWYTEQRFSSSGDFSITQPIVQTDGQIILTNRLSWQTQETEFKGINRTNEAFSNNLYLSFTQPLFTYNRAKMALKELELALENAQLNHSVQQLNIERAVTQSFYDVYREQERLKIASDEYDNQVKNFDIIKNKAESGMIAMEELYQAELNVSNSRSSLENQRVMVENAKDDFKILLGMDLEEEVFVSTNIISSFPEIEQGFAVEHGMTSRQELRMAEINLVYAQNELTRTQAQNEFKGEVSLSVGLFGEDEVFPNIYGNSTPNPKAMVSFQIPLFDWGAKKHNIKASEATVNTEQLDINQQQRDIQLGIIKVIRSLRNLETQIEIQEQSVRNAQLTYDINLERYKNGDITGLDLNQYQNQLSQAKIDLITARINYKLELLNLKIQSLWDFEANRSVLPEKKEN